MKNLLLALSCLLAASNLAAMPIYNDSDDRQFTPEIQDKKLLRLSDATVMLVDAALIAPDGTLSAKKMRENICPDEPYADELHVGSCSGVLIAPDMVATAGHCVYDTPIEGIRVVFGFTQKNASPKVAPDQVYKVSVAHAGGYPSPSQDIALLRLDRPAKGHTPVPIADKAPTRGQKLITAGHPLGTRQMVQGNGTVLKMSSENTFFRADLDVFGGQSGSPIFDASGRLVAIMSGAVPGQDLYLDQKANCYRYTYADTKHYGDVENRYLLEEQVKDFKTIFQSKGDSLRYKNGSIGVSMAPFMKQLSEQVTAKPLQPSLPQPSAKTAPLKTSF